MVLKRVIGVAGVIFVMSSSAIAADMNRGFGSLKDVPVPVVVPPWAGFYFGLHLGGIVHDDDRGPVDVDFDVTGEGSFDDQNLDNYFIEEDRDHGRLIGGVHVGYNWQRPGSLLVFGIEGDLDFSERVEYLASLRARLGVGLDRLLIYATAGIAAAEFDDRRFDVTYIGPRDDIFLLDRSNGDDTEWAFVVGAGAEFKLAQNVSLGVEGLYYDFDSTRQSVTFIDIDPVTDELATFSRRDDRDFWQVRARLTYHVGQTVNPIP